MWSRSFQKTYTGVTKEQIWKLWIDVNNWTRWHGDLDSCTMEGEFKVGNHFMLKPQGVSPVKIILTEVNPYHSFTDCTEFFGAKMYDTHAMEETPEGLVISHKVVVTGPLGWIWVKLVAQGVAADVPHEVDALVDLARRENG
jgi:hypothetical protein